MRVLLIDDNCVNLELMQSILADQDAAAAQHFESLESELFGRASTSSRPALPGFVTECCQDGRSGCELAAQAKAEGRPFAVAFVDMRMPGGWDGLQTIEALWRIDADLQVVICTAYSDHSWEDINARLGVSDSLLILRKPFDPIELLQLASALGEKWRLQRVRQQQLAELEAQVAARTEHLNLSLKKSLRTEQELQYRATHDALTGLANRVLFMDRLRQAVARARRLNCQLLVAFIDLDRFKLVNDSLGHELGDELLKAAAERMSACLRESDTLARIGGDEFALVLTDLERSSDGMAALDRLLERLAEPLQLSTTTLSVTCSLGCSAFPDDAIDADELLRFADAAMYRAKELGRNNIQVYNPALRARIEERVQLEAALRLAIERQQLELHYQPQIDLRSGRLSGLEALLRWKHPELGMVAPGRFIHIAEDTGLIEEIGEWTLRRACAQIKEWQGQGLQPPRVALNLSPYQVQRPGLVEMIEACLRESDTNPALLELELTESASMDDPERTIPLMRRLRALGLSLSIDDFGAGYSNMRYLKLFPVQTLKIDGCFVREITSDAGSMAIIDAVIAMAHRLGLKVVAEMAENQGQVMQLAARGCDLVQGYYFSRPLPPEQLGPLLREGCMPLPQRLDSDSSCQQVLVLDDEPSITNAIKRESRQQGYQVLTANSSAEAFDLLARHPVGVVISDQLMPDMKGTQFLNQVRMLYPDTIRILLTGFTDFRSAQEAINIGAVHQLLSKPWNAQELRQLIRESLERYGRTWQRDRVLE
ncbi:EAL domain-containing protein [Pseudomonas sp. CAU 1711]|uniref:EAL domain-containing protein n=1 Tax=Pseudomonas sp. CAU 1711 TaxID=3140356 RepID=UPI0032603A94